VRKDPAKPDVWRCCQTFLFSGKGADRVRLYWNQPTSQKAPRHRRGTANAAVGGAGANLQINVKPKNEDLEENFQKKHGI